MSHADLITLIQSVGAPTFIAVLVILRVEKRIDRLASLISTLPAAIAAHVHIKRPPANHVIATEDRP